MTVLVGPFAGHSGRITERQPDGRFLVVIDECYTPLVAALGERGRALVLIGEEVGKEPMRLAQIIAERHLGLPRTR